jgi:hypothetical protein
LCFFFPVFFEDKKKLHQKNFFKKTYFLNLIPYSEISRDSTSRSVEKVEGCRDGLQNKCTRKIPRGDLPVNFFFCCCFFASHLFASFLWPKDCARQSNPPGPKKTHTKPKNYPNPVFSQKKTTTLFFRPRQKKKQNFDIRPTFSILVFFEI